MPKGTSVPYSVPPLPFPPCLHVEGMFHISGLHQDASKGPPHKQMVKCFFPPLLSLLTLKQEELAVREELCVKGSNSGLSHKLGPEDVPRSHHLQRVGEALLVRNASSEESGFSHR